MYNDTYIDKPQGIPAVSFFKRICPKNEGFTETPDGKNIIFTNRHCHSDFEIIVIDEGRADFIVNGKSIVLLKGDVLLLNPYDMHFAATPADAEIFSYYCIDFDIDFLNTGENTSFFCSSPKKSIKFYNFIPSPLSAYAAEKVADINRAYTEKHDGWRAEVIGNLLLIFSFLMKNRLYSEENGEGNNFIKEAFSFVEENYSKPITSADAARALAFNHSYFCRCFKSNFSCTFSEFLNVYRIKRATAMIENGETRVSNLTTAVGFNNFSYFSKTFKKYHGILPSEYISRTCGK